VNSNLLFISPVMPAVRIPGSTTIGPRAAPFPFLFVGTLG